MNPAESRILTINGASSSLRFALYEYGQPLKRGLYGKVVRIGLSGTNLISQEANGKPEANRQLKAAIGRVIPHWHHKDWRAKLFHDGK